VLVRVRLQQADGKLEPGVGVLVEVDKEPQAGDDLTLADGRLVVRVVDYGRRPDGTLAYYVAVPTSA